MKLRIFLPAHESPGAPLRWMLLDARGTLVRRDAGALAAMPRSGAAELVLPASRVLFARLRLPRVGAATLRELLPFAVEDRLLADPAHIHAVAGRTDARGETAVAVIDREWLRGRVDALVAAGLRPVRAYCESALLPTGGDWHLVLGSERGMLVDADGVAVAFDRPQGDAPPLALRAALDEAAGRGARPARVCVHPEEGTAQPDLARWSAEAGIAFAPAEPWEERLAAAPAPGAIDLLAGERVGPRRGLLGLRVPRAAVAIAAAIVLVHVGLTAVQTWRLARERAAIEARREAIFRAAFPEARAVVDPALQMARNLAALRRARGLASDDAFLAQLTQAARASGAPVRSVEYANGRLAVVRAPGPVGAQAAGDRRPDAQAAR